MANLPIAKEGEPYEFKLVHIADDEKETWQKGPNLKSTVIGSETIIVEF